MRRWLWFNPFSFKHRPWLWFLWYLDDTMHHANVKRFPPMGKFHTRVCNAVDREFTG